MQSMGHVTSSTTTAESSATSTRLRVVVTLACSCSKTTQSKSATSNSAATTTAAVRAYVFVLLLKESYKHRILVVVEPMQKICSPPQVRHRPTKQIWLSAATADTTPGGAVSGPLRLLYVRWTSTSTTLYFLGAPNLTCLCIHYYYISHTVVNLSGEEKKSRSPRPFYIALACFSAVDLISAAIKVCPYCRTLYFLVPPT